MGVPGTGGKRKIVRSGPGAADGSAEVVGGLRPRREAAQKSPAIECLSLTYLCFKLLVVQKWNLFESRDMCASVQGKLLKVKFDYDL